MSNIQEALKNIYKDKNVRKINKFLRKLNNTLAPTVVANKVLGFNFNQTPIGLEIRKTFDNIINGKPVIFGGNLSSGNLPSWVKQDELKDNPDIRQNQPKELYEPLNNNHDEREPKDYPLPNIYIQPKPIFDVNIDINFNRDNQTGSENTNFNRPEIPERILTTKNLTFNQNVKLDLKNHVFGCLMNNPISSTTLYIADSPINNFEELASYIDTIDNELDDIINWLSGLNYGKLFKHGLALIDVQYRTIESVESHSLYLFTREHIQRLSNYYASRNATCNFPIITKIHDNIKLYNMGIANVNNDDLLENFHVYRNEQILDDLNECHIPIRNFKNYRQKGEGYRKQLQIVFINDNGETKDITIPNPIEDITSDDINEALITNTWYFGHAKFELNFNEWGYLRHYGDNDEDESVKDRFISLANNLSNNTIVINSFRKSIRERSYLKGFFTAYKAFVIYGGNNDNEFCNSFTL